MKRRGISLLCAILFLLSAVFLTLDATFGLLRAERETVSIPDLVGEVPPRDGEYDWISFTVEYRDGEGVPGGRVLSQSPPGGSLRKRREGERCPVTLYVSRGERTVLLPDLCGEISAVAASRLRALGFAVVTEERDSPYPAGTVYRMQPLPGEELPVGSRVTLSVSRGPQVESVFVPDVSGEMRADALVSLWLSGLSVGEVVELPSLRPSGEVLRQFPLAGERVPTGTAVTLYVAAENRE